MPPSIGFISKSLRASRGGSESHMKRLVTQFSRKSYEIYAFSTEFDDSLKNSDGIECVNIPMIGPGGVFKRLLFNYQVKRITAKYRDEIDLFFSAGKLEVGEIHKGGSFPSYLEKCGTWLDPYKPKNIVKKKLQRRMYEKSPPPTVIANATLEKQRILNYYDIDPNRIKVIITGIDTNKYNPKLREKFRSKIRKKYNIESTDFVSLWVGNDWERKGIEYVLKSLSNIEEERVKLIVAGSISESRLNRLVSQLGIEDRVIFAGYVSAIEKLYASSDVLVFPTIYDGAAQVVIEALATGLPVISSQANGSSELITDGENGYVLANESNYLKISEYLQQMSRNKSLLQSMKNKAAEVGQERDLKSYIQQIDQVIQQRLQSIDQTEIYEVKK